MSLSRTSPVIVVTDAVLFTIIDNKLKVLCVTRQRDPFSDKTSIPGTYVRNGESSKNAILRALKEKAGIADIYLEQLYTFDEIGRDPRGQYLSVAYFAVSHIDEIHLNISEKTQNPKFVDVTTPFAFDHNKIVDYAVSRLRSKLEYTTIAQSLLPKIFTLSDLQNVYEIVLDQKLDKRNFRKKFLSLNLLEPTGDLRSGLQQRPALLYRFKTIDMVEIPRWF